MVWIAPQPDTEPSPMRNLVEILLCGIAMLPLQAADPKIGPEYTADGRLKFPEHYREWMYLSSGVGMTYGPIAEQGQWGPPMFDNIFVNPEAYRAFQETGHWPDKTILVMEARQSESHASINNGGHFQTDIVGVEAEVKDSSTPEGPWNFYGFEVVSGKPVESAKAVSHKASCYTCHGVKTAVENTFVQFYPPLYDVAERKGTLNPGFEKLAITPRKLFDLIRLGGWNKGQAALEDAAKRAPDASVMNVELQNLLAYDLMGNGNVGDAVGLLEWTAARNPTSANTQGSLADAYERLGLPEVARMATERFQKLMPDAKALMPARRDRLVKAAEDRLKRIPPSPAGHPPPIEWHGGGPSVSPDGMYIAFSGERAGVPTILTVRVDGSSETQLTQGKERRSPPAWDRRGNQVVFATWADGKSTIYGMDVDGKNQRQLGIVPARQPSISPDGKRVVYSNRRIYVASVDGSDERPLTEGATLEGGAVWSPDGTRIAFVRKNADHMNDLWVMNADGSAQRQLTHIPVEEGQAEMPAWSADGRKIAIQVGVYTIPKEVAHIWIVDAARGDARKLAAHTGNYLDETPSWFPDGKHLAFQSNRTGRMEVWMMGVDGTGSRQVTR